MFETCSTVKAGGPKSGLTIFDVQIRDGFLEISNIFNPRETHTHTHMHTQMRRPGNSSTAAANQSVASKGREGNASNKGTVVSAATCSIYTQHTYTRAHTYTHMQCRETVICPFIWYGSDTWRMCSGSQAWQVVKKLFPFSVGTKRKFPS